MRATVFVTLAASVAATAAVAMTPHARPTTAHIAMRPAVLVAPVDHPVRGHRGDVGVTVPPVLFGPGDALPRLVSPGGTYDASVLVWCALGTGGGTARIGVGPVVALTPGKAVRVTARTAGIATIDVHAVVGGKDYERTYHHIVSDG